MKSGQKNEKDVPIWEKQNLTIPEAAKYSNIGTNKIIELISDPRCGFVLHVGRKRLIKKKAFDRYIEGQVEI